MKFKFGVDSLSGQKILKKKISGSLKKQKK